MLTTPLCRQLGIDSPIFCAPMGGGSAGPALASAVSNAGGLGAIGLVALPAPYIRELIRRTHALTHKPFLANLVIPNLQGGELEACFDEKLPILGLFWGVPAPFVRDAHQRGIPVIPQVGSVEEAVAAAEAGVDAVIAQGSEAGGHVRSTIALSVLLPAVVEAVTPVPVIAAGGIATAAVSRRHSASAPKRWSWGRGFWPARRHM
jgi:nitronate monooxygenase